MSDAARSARDERLVSDRVEALGVVRDAALPAHPARTEPTLSRNAGSSTVEARRADEDQLVDVLLVRVGREVAADRLVPPLRLRVRGELAFARQVEERHDRRDGEDERDQPCGDRPPRATWRRPARDARSTASGSGVAELAEERARLGLDVSELPFVEVAAVAPYGRRVRAAERGRQRLRRCVEIGGEALGDLLRARGHVLVAKLVHRALAERAAVT